MSSVSRAASLLILGLLALSPRLALAGDAATPAIPLAAASDVFAQARVICERDHGRFWGRSLCGPILLADPQTRAIVANQADAKGALSPAGAVFTGVLPATEDLANTPTSWSGTYWTELLWPLFEKDETVRHVMLAHELFHRIQRDLGMAGQDGDNSHLDTLEGRYLLQLEWRALERALEAAGPDARRRAAWDAPAFRAERYRLFPGAAENEHALELNEGVPEYTGVRLGLVGAKAQNAYAVRDLSRHLGDRTFVRSFAYATGPAYGLLIDRYAPTWRARLKSGAGFDDMLRAVLPAERGPAPTLETRAAAYDGAALRAAEVERERNRQALLATLRARFVEGPVLHMPSHQVNYEFNPSTLQPLDGLGTVYPHLRVTASFGRLEANNGALLAKDFSEVTVSAAGADLQALKGDGWSLVLKPGWTIKPGARPGDWVVVAPPAP